MAGLKSFIEKRRNFRSKIDISDSEIVLIDDEVLDQEYIQGSPKGEHCGITEMSEHFAWKRSFQNVWTGYPNDGKTQFALFMMLIMSLRNGWKWVVWSPEMKSSNFVNGQVRINYNDLVNILIWTIEGITPHYHVSEKYNCERLTLEKHISNRQFVKDHFVFIEPKDKTPDEF